MTGMSGALAALSGSPQSHAIPPAIETSIMGPKVNTINPSTQASPGVTVFQSSRKDRDFSSIVINRESLMPDVVHAK